MKDAYLSHVAYRGSLAEPQIAVVDCNAIMKGRGPDVRLEPGDIIFVPILPLLHQTLREFDREHICHHHRSQRRHPRWRTKRAVNVAVPVNVTTRQPPEPITRAPFFLERILAITVFNPVLI